jgi:coatomer subunit beta'
MNPISDHAIDPTKTSKKKIFTKKKFKHHGEKVKKVCLHSKEPWLLSSLYNGNAQLFNYETQTLEKTFEVSKDRLRTGLFIENRNWAVFAGDDKFVRGFNYNTQEKIFELQEHSDFVRDLLYVEKMDTLVSCSDDNSIIIWQVEARELKKLRQLKEHKHFVMCVAGNPKEAQVFASASLDGTIKMWNVNSGNSHMTLTGHQSGVNCVAFFSGDRALLLSGGDDKSVILWNYQVYIFIIEIFGGKMF